MILKRIHIIAIGLIAAFYVSAQVPAQTPRQALQDTINSYIASIAYVGKAHIKKVQDNASNVTIQTDAALSRLPLTTEIVSQLENLSRQYLGIGQHKQVNIISDNYNLRELITDRTLSESKRRYENTNKHNQPPLTSNLSRPFNVTDGLEGVHLAVYASHGLYYHQVANRWIFQRARLFTSVEDRLTSAFTMPYLVPMLENAGAVVVEPRERDVQTQEVIVDDSDIVFSKEWDEVEGKGWLTPTRPLIEKDNPFTWGTFHQTIAAADSLLQTRVRYTPQITKQGQYAVYVSYQTLTNSSQQVLYDVCHQSVHTRFIVNQRMGGGTWIYLGTFAFSTDTATNYVSIVNSGNIGEIVTTDAVRFGGGMGSVARYANSLILATDSLLPDSATRRDTLEYHHRAGMNFLRRQDATISSAPRYLEGSRYYLQYAGIPDSVYSMTNGRNDYTDDFTSRGRWINYISGGSPTNPQRVGLGIPIEFGLALHTDAGIMPADSTVGTLAIYTATDDEQLPLLANGVSRLAVRDYADYVQTQIVEDVRRSFAPEWQRRELMNASYSETRNPRVPTIIIELLAHQNPADMRYGLDPRFQFVASRAIYKGILKYWHEQYHTPYIVQPLPINSFNIEFKGNNEVRLSWEQTKDSLEKTADADSYIVYMRYGANDWDNGTMTKHKHFTVALQKDMQYDFRVVAVNRGGASLPSETLSAAFSSKERGKVMIVNAFTRVGAPDVFEEDSSIVGFRPSSQAVPYGYNIALTGEQYCFKRGEPWHSDDDPGFGASYGDKSKEMTVGNTFDYPVMHGKALLEAGYSFVSCSEQAVTKVPQEIDLIDIILGKQRQTTIGTEHKTTMFTLLSNNVRTALSEYLSAGGRMLMSGAYITSELNRSEADRRFMQEVLHADFQASNATKSGIIRPMRDWQMFSCRLHTSPNAATIACQTADAIKPYGKNSNVIARYVDSEASAAIGYTNNSQRLLICNFPLESLTDFTPTYLNAINWIMQ